MPRGSLRAPLRYTGRRPGRRPDRAGLKSVLVGILLLAAGCRLIEADTHNLGELHGPGGQHRYSGALEGNFEYVLRHKIGALFPKSRLAASKSPKPIKNPAGECFERLMRLSSYSSASPGVAGRQVEWFSRLAVDDPAVLSRERALVELGKAALRLEVEPSALPADTVAAGPAVLSEALTSLARAVRLTISGAGPRKSASKEARQADLAAAVLVIEDLELDLDGARRALLVSSELLAKGGLYSDATPALERVDLYLQRVCVERSLARALQDENAFVRAAAIESVARASGPEILAPILPRLSIEPVEVATRVLRLVTELGLPQGPPDPTKADTDLAADEVEDGYVAAIYRQLYRGEGEVRVRAMIALSVVTDAGIDSLREEDWQAWWNARDAGSDPTGVQTGGGSGGRFNGGSAGAP